MAEGGGGQSKAGGMSVGFARLAARAGAQAESKAAQAARRIAAAAAAEAPAGVTVDFVEAGEEGTAVRLSGRGLARRAVVEPELRWLIGRVR